MKTQMKNKEITLNEFMEQLLSFEEALLKAVEPVVDEQAKNIGRIKSVFDRNQAYMRLSLAIEDVFVKKMQLHTVPLIDKSWEEEKTEK